MWEELQVPTDTEIHGSASAEMLQEFSLGGKTSDDFSLFSIHSRNVYF